MVCRCQERRNLLAKAVNAATRVDMPAVRHSLAEAARTTTEDLAELVLNTKIAARNVYRG